MSQEDQPSRPPSNPQHVASHVSQPEPSSAPELSVANQSIDASKTASMLNVLHVAADEGDDDDNDDAFEDDDKDSDYSVEEEHGNVRQSINQLKRQSTDPNFLQAGKQHLSSLRHVVGMSHEAKLLEEDRRRRHLKLVSKRNERLRETEALNVLHQFADNKSSLEDVLSIDPKVMFKIPKMAIKVTKGASRNLKDRIDILLQHIESKLPSSMAVVTELRVKSSHLKMHRERALASTARTRPRLSTDVPATSDRKRSKNDSDADDDDDIPHTIDAKVNAAPPLSNSLFRDSGLVQPTARPSHSHSRMTVRYELDQVQPLTPDEAPFLFQRPRPVTQATGGTLDKRSASMPTMPSSMPLYPSTSIPPLLNMMTHFPVSTFPSTINPMLPAPRAPSNDSAVGGSPMFVVPPWTPFPTSAPLQQAWASQAPAPYIPFGNAQLPAPPPLMLNPFFGPPPLLLVPPFAGQFSPSSMLPNRPHSLNACPQSQTFDTNTIAGRQMAQFGFPSSS